MTSLPVREPQQDRSKATRQRLLEAAQECLVELGWTRTTVALVAERAGVSRGAAQHHYPTREALVGAAVDYIGDVQVAELEAKVKALPEGQGRRSAVVNMLLNIYTGRSFRAALHLWVAASTDPSLAALIKPLERLVGKQAHQLAVDLLEVDESVPGTRELVQATLDLARGLGLANLLTDDRARRAKIVEQWTKTLHDQLPPRR